MESVKSFITKLNSINERIRLDSPVYYEKQSSYMSGSVAAFRIGEESNARNSVTVKVVTTDLTIGGIKEGPITILDNTTVNNLNSFRYGKDIKSIKNLLNDKIAFNITLGRENNITNDDYIDHALAINSFGQNSLFKTYDYKKEKLIPFDDFEGKPKPESFLNKKHKNISGFPYTYNAKKSIGVYMNPEIASFDGAIDVFHVRSSHAASGINDAYIRGAKGLFGSGNWILTQNTTYGKKGSSFLDNLFTVAETQHDFFEDSQGTILTKPDTGYISSGEYKNSPFVEKNEYANKYSHMTLAQQQTLLVSSSRDDNETGTRFKSKQNGFMITPFYKINEQRSFGKDSIAFSGLLKR
jgi:hypothetical protein